jgi:hypothetical protein
VLRGPRFRALFRNVYVEASAPDTPTLRARAALAVAPPGAFASHASAARILEVPIPTLPDEHLTVLRQQDRRGGQGSAGTSCPPPRPGSSTGPGSPRPSNSSSSWRPCSVWSTS